MKVVIRAQAADDLENVYRWIAKDSPGNAGMVLSRLLDAIDRIIPAFPNIGRVGKVHSTREWIVSGLPYIIVYTIDEPRDVIAIIGVFHGAQSR